MKFKKNKKAIKALSLALAGVTLASTVPLATSGVFANNLNDLNNKANELENEANDLKKQQENLQTQQDDAEKKLSELKETLSGYVKRRNEIMKELDILIDQIADKREELKKQEDLQKQQYADMKLRIQFMYENQSASVTETIASSDDMGEALNAIEYYQKIYDYDRNQLDEIKKTKENIENIVKDLEDKETKLKADMEENDNLTRQVSDLITEQKNLVSKLDTDLSNVAETILYNRQRQEANSTAIKNEKEAIAAAKRAAEEARRRAEEAKRKEESSSTSRPSSGGGSSSSGSSYGGGSSGGAASSSMISEIVNRAVNNNGWYPASAGYCAQWVAGIYAASGAGRPRGDAIDYWYNRKSGGTSMSNCPVGAAVVTYPKAGVNAPWGHIGIYIGGGMVASNIGGVAIEPVSVFCGGKYGALAGWCWPSGTNL